jgi:uncharacterized protein HemX
MTSFTTIVAPNQTMSSSSESKHQTIHGADASTSSPLSVSASAAPAAAKLTNTGAILAAVFVSLFVILALGGFLFWLNYKKRKLEKHALTGRSAWYSRLI